jgi:hypothetical protein
MKCQSIGARTTMNGDIKSQLTIVSAESGI